VTQPKILSRLRGVHQRGNGWVAKCPAHDDRNPSLSIARRDGRILLYCHAGCPVRAILSALGIQSKDLFDPPRTQRRVVAKYDYCDEKGRLLYQVVRYVPKVFLQRRPGGSGRWVWNLMGVRRVIYRLQEVIATDFVLICEGEKDCETARSLNFVATCNPQGAGKWQPEFAHWFKSKSVVIIADADDPGRRHAQEVASSLYGKAKSIKVLEFLGPKDLTEWAEHGGTREQLLVLLNGTPEWKPQLLDGAEILTAIYHFIRRFVSFSEPQAVVVTLWVAHTHAIDAADSTPYLAITSAEKQSGKTRSLEVLDILVAKSWFTGRVTSAVLVRKVDAEKPTLLLDESDAAFGGEREYAETLRGVLNTGHRRWGRTSLCVGKGATISFKDFSTFSAKCIAGIGKLPDTIADRSIPIRLKRSFPGEVERFRLRNVLLEAQALRLKVESWCKSILDKLRDARPSLPNELSDRQQDGAEPLLAIADAAGKGWSEIARRALLQLLTDSQSVDNSVGVQLLQDIHDVFDSRGGEKISSAELTLALAELETSPWGEWRHGKPITAAKVAFLLRPYGIIPHNIRFGETVLKGYQRDEFEDSWKRYLKPHGNHSPSKRDRKTATPAQGSDFAATDHSANENEGDNVANVKYKRHNDNQPSSGVAVLARHGVEEKL